MSAHKKINWSRLRWAAKKTVLKMIALIASMALFMLPGVLAILTKTFWFLLLYPIFIFVSEVWDLYDEDGF